MSRLAASFSTASGWASGSNEQEEKLCQRPQIDLSKLAPGTHCILEENACLDQGRIIVSREELAPRGGGEPIRDKFGELMITMPYVHPDAADNERAGWQSRREPIIRFRSSYDAPDIQDPHYSDCIVPLIWWPPWLGNFGEFYTNSVGPIGHLTLNGAIDRNVTLVPDLDGFELQTYMSFFLEPFTNHPVQPLHVFSSRDKLDHPDAQSRCFERMLLCRLEHTFDPQFPPNDPVNGFLPDVKGAFPPLASVGQAISKFQMEALDIHSERRPEIVKVTFLVRWKSRRFVNIDEIVDRCRAWRPRDSQQSPDCSTIDITPDMPYSHILEEFQKTDILVAQHGSGLVNGWLLPAGAAMVEMHGSPPYQPWPAQRNLIYDRYYDWPARSENKILYFQGLASQATSTLETTVEGWLEDGHNEDIWSDRDMNIVINWAWLEDLLNLIVSINGSVPAYEALPADRVIQYMP
ncbi:hypothetical protein WJX84_012100 [Apatococcus fuscideae]